MTKDKVVKFTDLKDAMMSGSGPTVFALYDRNDLAAQACEELRRAGLAKQVYLTSFSDKTCIRK